MLCLQEYCSIHKVLSAEFISDGMTSHSPANEQDVLIDFLWANSVIFTPPENMRLNMSYVTLSRHRAAAFPRGLYKPTL